MLCVIPARKGSKRLPGKNLLSIGGCSLVERTVSQAIESGVFTSIVFSSDDSHALEMARAFDIDVRRRSDELSGDNVRAVEVVRELMNTEDYHSESAAMLLFITAPFRTAADIKAASAKLEAGYDSVLSITRSPEPPQFSLMKRDDDVVPMMSYDFFRKTTKKQALEPTFHPNFAIQAATREVLETYNGFMGDHCGFVEIPPERSVDIDTALDVKWAEFLIESGEVSA